MSRQIEGQMSIFDILKPENDKKLQKRALKCAGCAHFHDVVSGLGDIYHDTACLKDSPWAKFKNPEDPACKDYKPRKEDESADQ